MNKYSRLITQAIDKSPAQSMLYSLGLTKKDLLKTSNWNWKYIFPK